MENKEKVLKCGTATDSNRLAGSIYSAYQENPNRVLRVRVIGAGALNQAIKAVVISNKFFIKRGKVVQVQPSFQDSEEKVSALDLKIILADA